MKALYFDYNPTNYKRPTHHERITPPLHNLTFVSKCKTCGKRRKPFDDNDLKKLNIISKNEDVSDFPNHELIINSRINITAGRSTNYSFFFTQRQKVALIKIKKAIDSLPTSKEKKVLHFIFLSILNLSKITDYRTQSQDLYYVPNNRDKEQNIWYQYTAKYNKFIKAIKKLTDLNKSTPEKPVTYFNTINELIRSNKYGVHFIKDDYREVNENVDGKVDLILTDPPYTDQVPYLERSQLFYPWFDGELTEDLLKSIPVMKKFEGKQA